MKKFRIMLHVLLFLVQSVILYLAYQQDNKLLILACLIGMLSTTLSSQGIEVFRVALISGFLIFFSYILYQLIILW
ncbi:hypothetical protein [Streptococcus ovuberis]|uniref:Uncharacterized protein n=1 Tax=Streptococcus ovuberis TaxID=1936207 RepID=A0A7X6N0H7_9STRE|nr:hypothetical protein [Streptococcus ovuberis]NKZ19972.1 hypothetical protein [Streptococcus ovuberis]